MISVSLMGSSEARALSGVFEESCFSDELSSEAGSVFSECGWRIL